MKNSFVVTGDISGFTKMSPEDRENVVSSTLELITSWAGTRNAQIFRGDSFQLLFTDATEALKRCIQLRCWFKKNKIAEEFMLDARMAVGVGTIAYLGETVLNSDGEAFHLSGRAFDALEGDEFFKVIKSQSELNEQLAIICKLADIIISAWTRNQAEVIFLAFEGKTQQQMANELDITQSAINNRLKLSNWKHIEKTIYYISSLLET
jgi:hypothetical protein